MPDYAVVIVFQIYAVKVSEYISFVESNRQHSKH